MADNIDINVNVNTTQAQKNLNNLNKQLETVQDNFAGLKRALLGAAAVSFAASIFRYADAMQDLSESTGIATASLLGFDQAIRQNGGEVGAAEAAVNRFVLSVGEAANGSLKAQNAFAKVGVSLEDIGKLSETELLNKTIIGFGKLTDKVEAASVSNEIFSKTLRGTNIAGVAGQYATATLQNAKYAQSIKEAAAVQQDFKDIVNDLTKALSPVAASLKTVSQAVKDNIDAVKSFISVAIEIGKVVAILFVAGRVLKAVYDGVKLLAAAIGLLSKGASGLKNTLGAFVTQLKAVWREGAVTGKTVDGLQKRMKYLREELPMLSKGLQVLAVGFYAAYQAAKAFFSSKEKITSAEQLEEINKQTLGLHNLDLQERDIERRRQTESGLKKRIAELQKLGQQYKENQDAIVKSINNEATYLKMSEDAAEVAKAQNEIYDNAIKLIGDLQQQITDLTEDEKGLKDELLKQIDVIEKSIPIDQMRAEKAIRNLQELRNAQTSYTRALEDTQRALQQNESLAQLQEELDLIGLYGDELEKQTQINQINRDLRQQMVDLSIELLKLDAQRTRIGEENYNIEHARIVQQMRDAQELSDARVKAFEEEQKRKSDLENSYYQGAIAALEDMAEQFKPINVAQQAITQGFDKIGDAISDFVETGKFNFKDFARSVLADLAKMLAKAALFKALQASLGFFGLSLPGLAEGGPAKKGQPYIVGEKGPELFVPRESGTVVPNNKMNDVEGSRMVNAPVTNNYITNNINALDAKSVAQLFAENRKALLGSVRTAEKELPYRA